MPGGPGLTDPFSVQQHVDSLVQAAGPGDLTRIDEEDLVGILDGIQAMRDDDTGGARRQVTQDLFQQFFGDGIDIGRRLVEDEQVRVAEHGPHKGNELFLPQADAIAAGCYGRIEARVETRQQGFPVSVVNDGGKLPSFE